MNLIKIPALAEDGSVHCIVETPRGSKAKFYYDAEMRLFAMSKSLHVGLSYPYDWGFIPSTVSGDGDPLDVMIVHNAATFPGMLLLCNLIGVLKMNDVRKSKKERNDRLFVVPLGSHTNHNLKDVRELSEALRKELEAFFAATNALKEKDIEVLGWESAKEAQSILDEAMATFAKKKVASKSERK
jgi:inorganic pyrophosphatase